MASENVFVSGIPSIDRPWLKYYKKDIYELPDTDTSMYRFLYECNKNRLDDIALNYFGKQISFRSMVSVKKSAYL